MFLTSTAPCTIYPATEQDMKCGLITPQSLFHTHTKGIASIGDVMKDPKIDLIESHGFMVSTTGYLPYVSYDSLEKALLAYIEKGKPDLYRGFRLQIRKVSEVVILITPYDASPPRGSRWQGGRWQ